MSQMHNIKFSKMYGSLRSLVHQDKITLSHSSPIKPHTLRVRVGKYQWRNKGQTGPRGDQKTSQPTVNLSLLSIDQFSNNSFVCWFFSLLPLCSVWRECVCNMYDTDSSHNRLCCPILTVNSSCNPHLDFSLRQTCCCGILDVRLIWFTFSAHNIPYFVAQHKPLLIIYTFFPQRPN